MDSLAEASEIAEIEGLLGWWGSWELSAVVVDANSVEVGLETLLDYIAIAGLLKPDYSVQLALPHHIHLPPVDADRIPLIASDHSAEWVLGFEQAAR